LVDIYYISPQRCFRDVGIVKSVNSLDYISLLTPEIIHILEGLGIGLASAIIYEKRHQIMVKIKGALKILLDKRFWPTSFSELLEKDDEVKEHLKDLVRSTKIGKQPPSTDIYPQATEELWSIQVTYSEALRAELRSTPGLLPLISSCKTNKNLVAKICVADPEEMLLRIAETEIKAIYGELESEKIQSDIVSNAYPYESRIKFLFPYDLDYIRKLNDVYAALWLLKSNAEEEGVDNQIEFYTYANDPTLRATFVYGESKIRDFVYFPENWTGMTGTMFRCEVLDGTPIDNRIFKKAENEREKLGLKQRSGLLETIENELIEKIDARGLDRTSFKNNRTKEEVIDGYHKISKALKNESYRSEERKRFLQEIAKQKKDKVGVTPELKISVLPHK
jgi:hypothetical protein